MTRFNKSADTKIIESVLREAKVGETVTYESLSKAIGRDVRKFAQGAINSARKSLLNDCRMVFGCVTNVGLKRMGDQEIIASTESDRRRIQRTSNRALKKLSSVEYELLDNESKKNHTTAAAQLGVLAMMSQASATKKIETKVNANSETLAIGETLKMFLGE